MYFKAMTVGRGIITCTYFELYFKVRVLAVAIAIKKYFKKRTSKMYLKLDSSIPVLSAFLQTDRI